MSENKYVSLQKLTILLHVKAIE